MRRDRGTAAAAARRTAVACLVAALPLFYYWLLARGDPSWRLAGGANSFGHWPLWVTVAGLAPLGIPALFAYRQRPRNLGDWMLRAWPVAGLLVFYLPFGTFPFHAFQGLALPLAVLAVLAVRSWMGEREMPVLPAAAVVALLTVPGTLYKADAFRDAVASGRQAFFLEPGERDALRWIEAQPGPGGVLAANVDSAYIPAYTGREAWTGAGSWTPDLGNRAVYADSLVAGRLSPEDARKVIAWSGARFIYVSCRFREDLEPALKLATPSPPRRFGCARVWELPRPPGGWGP